MSYEVQVGFEFEHGSTLSQYELGEAFTKATGYPIGPYTPGNYPHYSLHDDYSVYPNIGDGVVFRAELVSPPKPFNKAIEDLEMVLDFLQGTSRTCSTSGLHVGMSFIDSSLNTKVNALELLFSMPEISLLKSYGRYGNHYSQSLQDIMHTRIIPQIGKRDLIAVRSHLARRYYSHGRYSMEFGKLLYSHVPDDRRYIEFRIAGGPNYPKRFKDIRETIDIYRQSMIFSLDRNDDFVLASLEKKKIA
jgi:hypothetical protein